MLQLGILVLMSDVSAVATALAGEREASSQRGKAIEKSKTQDTQAPWNAFSSDLAITHTMVVPHVDRMTEVQQRELRSLGIPCLRKKEGAARPGRKLKNTAPCREGSGVGLLAATGVVAGLSWGSYVAMVAGFENTGVTAINWGTSVATWVLAPLAGQRRGRYDAHAHAARFGTTRRILDTGRRARRFIAIGGSLLALGSYLQLINIDVRGGFGVFVPGNYIPPLLNFPLVGQIAGATTAAGAGILMYGLEYRRETQLLEHLRIGLSFNGVNLSGKF